MERSIPRLLSLACLALALGGADPYTAPDGDLNRDGVVDAVDLQCEVLLFDALQGASELTEDACAVDGDCPPSSTCRPGPTTYKLCFPGCLAPQVTFGPVGGPVCDDPDEDSPECLGTVAKPNADMNCDEAFTNVDFQFVVALVMGKAGGPGTADVDGDGLLNFCDPDSDGDVVEDPDDCSPLDPTVAICDDGNVCTDDSCTDGACTYVNNAASCGPNHVCQGGSCVAQCVAGDYATWSGTCTAFCAGKGCGTAQVFGAPHSNLCGCTCCQASTGGAASGPYGGGFADCALVQGGWIPYCATTCRCGP